MANEFKVKNGLIAQKIKPLSDSTTALQVNNAGDTTTLINVDTTNNRIGIGKTAPGYSLDVNSTLNATTLYENGTALTSKYLQLSGGTLTGGLTGTTGSFSSVLFLGSTSIATSSEATLFLGAMGASEGGQLVLQKGTSGTYATHLDNYTDQFRVMYGTNTGSAGVALAVSMSSKQLILPAYQNSTSFTGTPAGYLAFDSSGNVLSTAVPTGAVSSVSGGTGVSVNTTTGAVTVSIGQTVSTTSSPTFDQVLTTNNGNGTNVKLGDDAWIGDTNIANTTRIKGVQDTNSGFIAFGATTSSLGATGNGILTYNGSTVWHSSNLTNLNQLTNGPGYTTNTGTVTSIATSAPLSGGTITTSGTISLASGYGDTQNPYASKTANYFLAAPNGSAGTPSFRAIVAADIPTLNQSTTGSAGSVTATVTGTNSVELVRGNMADNDQFRILVAGTASNAGYVEIATADDGTEPIYVRQYTGVFTTLTRTATLLDGSGNTTFPGTVSGTSFNSITGLASSNPNMDGTAAIGTSTLAARQDHVHASDTSRVSTGTTLTINGTAQDLSTNRTWSVGTVTSVSGTGTVSGLTLTGTVTSSGSLTLGGTLAVTPSNFSIQAPNTFLAGPTTGATATPSFRAIVAADIPTLNQNTTGSAGSVALHATNEINIGGSYQGDQLYVNYNDGGSFTSYGFYNGVTAYAAITAASFNSITGLASANPLMNGTVAVGTSTRVARQDHVHPSDTNKANTGGGNATGTWPIGITGSAGSVANSVTFNNGGAGDASGTTYNGSAARTISYNTVGAAASSHTHLYAGSASAGGAAYYSNFLNSADTRGATTTPQTIDRGLTLDFKTNTVEGLSDGGSYFGELTYRQWGSSTDWSGGKSHQLGFTDNENIWHRAGTSTTWNAWKKLIDSSNYTGYSPTLTGGSASGTWPIGITGNAATVTNGLYTTTSFGGDVSGTYNAIVVADDSHNHSSSTGNFQVGGDLYSVGGNVYVNSGDSRSKYAMWGNNDSTYGIGMGGGYSFGSLNDYAMTFQMSNTAARGFWWGDDGHTNAQGAMSLTTTGLLTVASGIRIGYGESDATDATANILDVSGSLKLLTATNTGKTAGTSNIFSQTVSSTGTCVIIDYTIVNSGNTAQRSGTFTANFNSSSVTTSETSTPDLGTSTAAVKLQASVGSGTIAIAAVITGSDTWTIKTSIRYF